MHNYFSIFGYSSDEDKAEALEQVKALAEVGQNPQEGTMKKAGKTAMTMLKGILAGLPIAVLKKVRYALCPMPYALCPIVPHVTEKGYSAATLVEACSKLLPAIGNLLLLP
ncbi:hypothetical protein [Microcoleus sp.]|uniref:hypothetical protein n=1 Tax=Microcoleus sp. TaxID=44472 RepID=UPI00403EC238